MGDSTLTLRQLNCYVLEVADVLLRRLILL